MCVLSKLSNGWRADTCGKLLAIHLSIAGIINIPGIGDIIHLVVYGYGSIIAVSGLIFFLAAPKTSISNLSLSSPEITAGIFSFYGIRLVSYLFYRSKFTEYEKDVMRVHRQARIDGMPFYKRLFISLGATALFGCYVLPLYFKQLAISQNNTYTNNNDTSFSAVISFLEKFGNAAAIFGVIIEAIADHQKTAHKHKYKDTPIMSGIYKMCRHPNYFGELLFHYGICLGCISGCTNVWSTMGVVASPLLCSLEMYRATKDLDTKQQNKYKELQQFKNYVKSTPCLFPIPGLTHIGAAKI